MYLHLFFHDFRRGGPLGPGAGGGARHSEQLPAEGGALLAFEHTHGAPRARVKALIVADLLFDCIRRGDVQNLVRSRVQSEDLCHRRRADTGAEVTHQTSPLRFSLYKAEPSGL